MWHRGCSDAYVLEVLDVECFEGRKFFCFERAERTCFKNAMTRHSETIFCDQKDFARSVREKRVCCAVRRIRMTMCSEVMKRDN